MLTKIYRRMVKDYLREYRRRIVLVLNEGRVYPYCLPRWQKMFHCNNKKHGDRRRMIIKARAAIHAAESWRERRLEEARELIERAKQ